MKYLLVSEYFHPHWTGIAKYFLSLAKSLAEEGHQVQVLTTRFSADLAQEESYQGFIIRRERYWFRLSRTHYSPTIVWRLIKEVRKFDEVIVNSPCSNVLFVAFVAKCFGRKVTIFHQGDLLLPREDKFSLKNLLIEKTFDVLTYLSMWLADTISANTEDYASHSRVMKHFLYKFKPLIPKIRLPSRNAVRQPEALSTLLAENKRLVGFAGRFVDEKGFDILLKAVPEVLKIFPDVHFVFAGETNIVYERCFSRLEKQLSAVNGHLTLLGLLPEEQLFAFYEALSVFVISSRSDCFPLTQAEAALVGVPIVVTNIPGARMLVKSTGFGEIVPPEDPISLADGILKVLVNRDKYMDRADRIPNFFTRYERLRAN